MADDSHTTDLGNAKRFVARHGMSLRYVPAFKAWYFWAGTHWQRDEDGEAERRTKETVLAIYDDAQLLYDKATMLAKATSFTEDDDKEAERLLKRSGELWRHARQSEGAARIAAMLRLAQTERGVPVAAELLDANDWLLNFHNGTLDLHNDEFRQHHKEDLITIVLPYDYKPEARLQLWDDFLESAVPDDEMREFLQRAAGASLVGEALDDKILILIGPGGTGKSTVQEALKAAMGSYAATASLDAFVGRKGSRGAADPELALLRGKRAVFIPEAGTGAKTVELLEAATGGDTTLVRTLYERPFELRPTFTLWMRANTRPRLPDNDSGLRRRLVELPFHHVFARPDESIRETLKTSGEAHQAVIVWALAGMRAWRLHGLREIPDSVTESTQDFWQEMDPLSGFFDDCCLIAPCCRASAGNSSLLIRNGLALRAYASR